MVSTLSSFFFLFFWQVCVVGGGVVAVVDVFGRGASDFLHRFEVMETRLGKAEKRRVADKTNQTVKTALRRRGCELVTLDWLEDSMMRGRKLPEEPYSHLRVLRREREKERRRQGILKGMELAVRQVNPSMLRSLSRVWREMG